MRTEKIVLFAEQTISIVILSILMSCNTNTKNNQTDDVLEFFTKSELQYETEQQKESIITALSDILNLDLSEDELKNKKYPNYTGEENQWDLPTLINKYFVPADQNIKLGDNFYTKFRRKEIQEQIQEILVGLQDVDKTVKNVIGLWGINNSNNNDTLKISLSNNKLNIEFLNVKDSNFKFFDVYFNNNELTYYIVKNDTIKYYKFQLSENSKTLIGGTLDSWEGKTESIKFNRISDYKQ